MECPVVGMSCRFTATVMVINFCSAFAMLGTNLSPNPPPPFFFAIITPRGGYLFLDYPQPQPPMYPQCQRICAQFLSSRRQYQFCQSNAGPCGNRK